MSDRFQCDQFLASLARGLVFLVHLGAGPELLGEVLGEGFLCVGASGDRSQELVGCGPGDWSRQS